MILDRPISATNFDQRRQMVHLSLLDMRQRRPNKSKDIFKENQLFETKWL